MSSRRAEPKTQDTDNVQPSRLPPEVLAPTGHVALVFTDIRNSTHLWDANAGMRTAVRLYNQLLRRQLRLCGGYEVKTEGDAFMCSFQNALSALKWCLTVQLDLLHESWPLEILECEIATDEILRALTPRLISEDSGVMSEATPLPSSAERMETDPVSLTNTSTNNAQAESDADSASLDPSKYTVLCPILEYFETSDVDGCSLGALYAMMTSRCDEIYEDIRGHVDTSSFPPTPEEFKTLHSIVLPCDPLYSTLSHPQILEGLERTVYF